MKTNATIDAMATTAVTVHGKTRLRKGLLARFSLVLITPTGLTRRIHAAGEPAQTALRSPLLPYTLKDERGCGKSWTCQALAGLSRRSRFKYRPRRVNPSSRAAREILPLCLRK